MKQFKFMSLMLALMACTFAFVSCGDDDEEEVSVTKDQLIGTWEMTHISGWFYDEDDNDNVVKRSVNMDINESTLEEYFKLDIAELQRYQFTQTQFTVYSAQYYGDEWKEEFTVPYTLEGNKVKLGLHDGFEDEFIVFSVSANQLVLKSSDSDKEEGDLTITYKRIK